MLSKLPIQYLKNHLQIDQICRSLVKDCLMTEVSAQEPRPARKKVTVVGSDPVGATAAFSLLSQQVIDEVCLVDANIDQIRAEKMDLEQGSVYINNPEIIATSDYAKSANSDICIITAEVRGEKDEDRFALLQCNADLYKNIIPNVIKYSPESKLLIISNPVDVMTYVAWKLSGFPTSRVLGIGTLVESARFRFFLSQRLGVLPQSVDAFVIGEHGESSVAIWSTANVTGMRLCEINPDVGCTEDLETANRIIKLKGDAPWAIGVVAGAVSTALLRNNNRVLPVSTCARGFHGIKSDVFLSLPCVVNSNGIEAVINQKLSKKEVELLQKSAKILGDAQDSVKL